MKQILLAGGFLALLLYFLGNLTPGVIRDVRIGSAYAPAVDLKVDKARCTTHSLVVTTCSVTYRPRGAASDVIGQSVDSLMLGGAGAERVMLVRSLKDGAVTTDVNLAKLTNRVVALMVLGALALSLVLFGIVRLTRGEPEARLA